MAAIQSRPADTIEVTLAAAAVSGVPFLAGTMLLVPITDGAIGDVIACHRVGMHELPKVSAQAWTIGQALYWNAAGPNVTSTASTNQRIGTAGKVAANPSTIGWVILGQF
jgi:predicted RecA/RadA family phage recombinase